MTRQTLGPLLSLLVACGGEPQRQDVPADSEPPAIAEPSSLLPLPAAPLLAPLLAPLTGPPPPGSPCASAQRIALAQGHGSAQGDTTQHDPEPFALTCAWPSNWSPPPPMDGPQAYFVFAAREGQWYRLRLTAEFDQAMLYVFSNPACSASTIATDCQSRGQTGATSPDPQQAEPQALYYQAKKSGDVYVAVDSGAVDRAGAFVLDVDAIARPNNRTCATASPLAFSAEGKALARGDVGAALTPDDLWVTCTVDTWKRIIGDFSSTPQVYHRFDAKPFKTYRIALRAKSAFGVSFYVVAGGPGACEREWIEHRCASGGSSGDSWITSEAITQKTPGVLHYQPTKPGPQLIAVEGWGRHYGEYELEVTELESIPHSRCASALPVALDPDWPTKITGSTTGATNEHGYAIHCQTPWNYEPTQPLAGPQLYFKLQLEADTTYEIYGSVRPIYLFPASACGDAEQIRQHICDPNGMGALHDKHGVLKFYAWQGGAYILAVDGYSHQDHGELKVQISRKKQQ